MRPSKEIPPQAGRGPAAGSTALATACVALLAVAAGGPAPASAASGGAAPVRIALRPTAEVVGPDVTLGDVAVLTTRDLETLRQLMALSVGRGERGGTLRLERDRLAPVVQARAGVGIGQVEWVGAAASVVRLAGREVSGEAIAREAETALRAALDGVRIERRQIPRPVHAPAGRLVLRTRGVAAATVMPRRLSVWVDVRVDGRLVRSVPVGFALGPGASAASARGAPTPRREPAVDRRPPAPEIDDAPAPVAASPSSAPPPHATNLPLVARGTWAVLRAGQGAVVLESRAEVLEDGRSGEAVRVRLPNASSTILARVTGPGTLEVLP